MSNIKVQIANQIQKLNVKNSSILEFNIDLTFACLPRQGRQGF
jgi:hypothetical protein